MDLEFKNSIYLLGQELGNEVETFMVPMEERLGLGHASFVKIVIGRESGENRSGALRKLGAGVTTGWLPHWPLSPGCEGGAVGDKTLRTVCIQTFRGLRWKANRSGLQCLDIKLPMVFFELDGNVMF